MEIPSSFTAMRVRAPAGLDNLVLGGAEQVPPGPGQIVVRIHASSLNFHDYHVALGKLPVEDGRIPLCDGAGEVVGIGAGVREFAVGDGVTSLFYPRWQDGLPDNMYRGPIAGNALDGFASEYVTRNATDFTRSPAGYSHAEAATLPCAGLTAWRALFIDGALKPGDVVVTQGSGGVSVFALQFAKAAGAVVIATSSSEAKMARLKAFGADHVVNYRDHPDWGAAVMDLTRGRGADHIIEVGGAGTFEQSMAASRVGGHIAVIGVLASPEGHVNTRMMMSKQLRIIGLTVGSRRDQNDMVRGIDAIGLRPVIDIAFPLAQLADAFRHQEANRHFGKIGITV